MHQEQQGIFKTFRRLDNLSTLFSMLGLLLTLVSYERDISQFQVTLTLPKQEDINGYDAMQTDRFLSVWRQFFRWTVFGTSLISVVFLCTRRLYKKIWFNNFVDNYSKSVDKDYGPLHMEYTKFILGI